MVRCGSLRFVLLRLSLLWRGIAHPLAAGCVLFRFARLLGIKRVMLQKRAQIKLDFVPPEEGQHTFKLYGVCDSYLGCDAEVSVELDVKEPEEMDSSSEEEEGDE